MSEPDPAESRDPVFDRVSESSLRLMSGLLPRRTMEELRGLMLVHRDSYPWQKITDTILAEPIDDHTLLQQGLRAQRDWILRGGRERPRRRLRARGKTLLAYLASRAVFFVLYTLAVVVLLILLEARWPWLDIYEGLPWLQRAFPGLFGGG